MPNIPLHSRAYLSLMAVAFMATMVLVLPIGSKAQDTANFGSHVTGKTILWSARACYLEATFSHSDCSALLSVIKKRAFKFKATFLDMLRRYTALSEKKNPRLQKVCSYGLACSQSLSKDLEQRWFNLVEHVSAVLAGVIKDPCPQADNWAAPGFQPSHPMKRVECDASMQNYFWRSLKGW